ncbi:MAG TPA: low affinity iron permease family protein [Acetobacteraceae bacterium]|nr:low affinity iron permease family protein [Acetobacteraceae bacterium]
MATPAQPQAPFSISNSFSMAAQWTSCQCGRPTTFALACLTVAVWAATGPMFHYSDTWQLVINTGTTIVTFLMVFLIQNTQNRDMSVLQLKLDELIRVSESARNKLLDLENMTDEELTHLKGSFARLAAKPAAAALQEMSEDLEAASEDIQEAKEKVTALQGATYRS